MSSSSTPNRPDSPVPAAKALRQPARKRDAPRTGPEGVIRAANDSNPAVRSGSIRSAPLSTVSPVYTAMPAPIFERIADKLGLPPQRSEKLVRAMIREIRKRADQGQGVRVPNLGSFVVENGELTFNPEPSLARSVNQRFEGLSEETVALPEVEESAQSGEGPTTITRGFDMGAWDPLDTGGASSNTGKSRTADSGPDTDEFNPPPDTDEFKAPPDTDEFTAPDTGTFETAEQESSHEKTAAEQGGSRETPDPSPSTAESTEGGDATAHPSWDVGSAQPVKSAQDSTKQDSTKQDNAKNDTFSPAQSRGEDPLAGEEEPDIDTSSPLQVADHRQTGSDADKDPYDGSSFQTSDTRDDSSRDAADRDSTEDFDAPSPTQDEPKDDESNIWASESVWDFSTVTSEDVEDDEDINFDDAEEAAEASAKSGDTADDEGGSEYVSYRPPDADEQAAEERPSRSIFDFDEESAVEKKASPKTTKLDASEIQNLDKKRERENNDGGSRGAATTVTVIVVLILVSIGGWIALGQRGIVPSPSRTLGLSDGLTETSDAAATDTDDGGPTAEGSTGEPTDASPADANPTATPSGSPEAASDASSSGVSPDASRSASAPPSTQPSGASQGFDRSAGGFTIAVASRESESDARALVEQFRRNLSDTNLRIDVVVGESGGTTRYRVGVGQFSTRTEANNMRNDMQSRLPNGAWPVPIE